MSDPKFETVIVTYNSAAHIHACLTSLTGASAGIVVVDNGSSDETLNIIKREFAWVRIVATGQNLGYGKALNLGIAHTKSPFVVAANADSVFPEGSLQMLAGFMAAHPRVGVAGPQELFPDGSWQRSYADVPGIYEAIKALLGWTFLTHTADRLALQYRRSRKPKHVGYVDGAIMMIRRAAFDEIGGFDDSFHFYCEDADLCLRLRQVGWDVVSVPAVHVFHARGGSSTRLEGYSDSLLNSLATAERKLIRKHHPRWHFRLYRRLCILHARKMSLIYRLLRRFNGNTVRTATLMSAFERWACIWTELET